MLKRLKLLEKNLLKYGVAAILMVIPLYPKFPLIFVPGTWVAIRLEDFLIAAISFVWLFTFFRERKIFFKESLNRIIFGYFAIGFLSLASAVLITKTVTPYIGFLHTIRRVEYMIVFFIAAASIKSRSDIIFYSEVILLTAFLVFLYGLGQKLFGLPVISTMNIEFAKGLALSYAPGARVNSTFAGHYDLAAYLVLILSFIIAIFFGLKRAWQKALVFICFLSCFWLLLVSASRISFAAYLGSITLTLWLLKKRLFIVPVLALSLFASLFVPELTQRYNQMFQVSLNKMLGEARIVLPWQKKAPTEVAMVPTPTPLLEKEEVIKPIKKMAVIPTPTPQEKEYVFYGAPEVIPEDRSLEIRLKAEWPRAIQAFFKNPLLGTGFSSITLATDNDYLRALGEIGILGFFAFILILVELGRRSFGVISKTKREDFLRLVLIGISGGMIGFLANAIFIDVFEASKVAITFWLLAGIMVGISKLELARRKG